MSSGAQRVVMFDTDSGSGAEEEEEEDKEVKPSGGISRLDGADKKRSAARDLQSGKHARTKRPHVSDDDDDADADSSCGDVAASSRTPRKQHDDDDDDAASASEALLDGTDEDGEEDEDEDEEMVWTATASASATAGQQWVPSEHKERPSAEMAAAAAIERIRAGSRGGKPATGPQAVCGPHGQIARIEGVTEGWRVYAPARNMMATAERLRVLANSIDTAVAADKLNYGERQALGIIKGELGRSVSEIVYAAEHFEEDVRYTAGAIIRSQHDPELIGHGPLALHLGLGIGGAVGVSNSVGLAVTAQNAAKNMNSRKKTAL